MGQTRAHARGQVIGLVKLKNCLVDAYRMNDLARRFTHGAIG